ncbi:MAG: prolyl oligopeptidase family serine peptidase [Maribacter sp.]|nr:prolyl oligopeptidase family serine peptidase [Maribacter sp.]
MLASIPISASAALLKDQRINIEGHERTFDIYLPKRRSGKPMPLVLLLHGHGGDADTMTGENKRTAPYKAWLSIAEREGWIVLVPDGEIGPDKYRGWNDCRRDATSNPSTDDVKFLNVLVDSVSRKYPVDKKRIYAHGTSNGGHMAYRLALESTEKFSAIAAVVAAMPRNNACEKPTGPISVLIMNGTTDPILPYNGGGVGRRNSHKEARGIVLSTAHTVKYWLANNGITSNPTVKYLQNFNKSDDSSVVVKQYVGGQNNTEVILYEVRGGGHTEPSLNEYYGWLYRKIVGNQNKDTEMAEEVWKFFERH